MNLWFFASFIVFCFWLGITIKKQDKKNVKSLEYFLDREAAANNTRRKPMDDLEFITVPLDFLPFHILPEAEDIKECQRLVKALSTQKIVNLTGLSNTDLKLRYGVPNLNFLSDCDQNYTVLARTLQKWAALIYDAGYTDEAKTILEFAVSTKTDISATYALLCKIYDKTGQTAKIESLLQIAEGLNSASKPTIVRILQEAYPYND